MQATLIAFAFIAGFGLTIQVGLNAAVRNAFGNAATAAFVNFAIGLLALLAYLLATRAPLPTREAAASIPAWAWFGGFLGAFYVATAAVAGPRLGATVLLALTVFGQLIAALLVDQFGWLGFPQVPVTPLRVLGAAMVFGGVLLVSYR
jgi:transporter family-2 protein